MDHVRIDWKRIERPDAQVDQVLLRFLILRIAATDTGALRTLYYRTGGKLLALLRLLLDDRDSADDAIVDVFVRIWNEAHRFDEEAVCPSQWLFVIVRRVADSRSARWPDVLGRTFIGPLRNARGQTPFDPPPS